MLRRHAQAAELPPSPARDVALHGTRKAAKRARYAAEAARPTLGKPAKKLGKRVKAVQSLLGEHQDSVVARAALREFAIQSHGAGESAFTWGLLYGREEAAAATSVGGSVNAEAIDAIENEGVTEPVSPAPR